MSRNKISSPSSSSSSSSSPLARSSSHVEGTWRFNPSLMVGSTTTIGSLQLPSRLIAALQFDANANDRREAPSSVPIVWPPRCHVSAAHRKRFDVSPHIGNQCTKSKTVTNHHDDRDCPGLVGCSNHQHRARTWRAWNAQMSAPEANAMQTAFHTDVAAALRNQMKKRHVPSRSIGAFSEGTRLVVGDDDEGCAGGLSVGDLFHIGAVPCSHRSKASAFAFAQATSSRFGVRGR
eukprot:1184363-Rhodomonas_salina.3